MHQSELPEYRKGIVDSLSTGFEVALVKNVHDSRYHLVEQPITGLMLE